MAEEIKKNNPTRGIKEIEAVTNIEGQLAKNSKNAAAASN